MDQNEKTYEDAIVFVKGATSFIKLINDQPPELVHTFVGIILAMTELRAEPGYDRRKVFAGITAIMDKLKDHPEVIEKLQDSRE